MRKFLQKVGLRLAILAGIWVIFTQVIPKRLYLGPEYSRWETVWAGIGKVKEAKAPVNLVIGDSRPEMGLASKHLRAWNYGLGGTSPVEGYYMLQQLADVPIDTLYLSYSPYHFHFQDCFHNRSEYFGFIAPGYIAEVESLSLALNDTVFQWNNWAWLDDLDHNFPLPWVQRQFRYLPPMRGLDNWRWYFRDRPEMQQRMADNQLSYLFPSSVCPGDTSVQEYFLEQQAGGFVLNPVNEFYFRKLLAEVTRREIHLVWINMPLNRAVRQPSAKYYADFERWLLAELPTGTPYIPLAYRDSCDFKDFSHLDALAAEAYAKELTQRLASQENPLP
ncbi:MAG TPA: hypothetical protein VHS96_14760 [Bacteroidia bacterium]|nr:hypothetical protein [Bacteroidia bacterium]